MAITKIIYDLHEGRRCSMQANASCKVAVASKQDGSDVDGSVNFLYLIFFNRKH